MGLCCSLGRALAWNSASRSATQVSKRGMSFDFDMRGFCAFSDASSLSGRLANVQECGVTDPIRNFVGRPRVQTVAREGLHLARRPFASRQFQIHAQRAPRLLSVGVIDGLEGNCLCGSPQEIQGKARFKLTGDMSVAEPRFPGLSALLGSSVRAIGPAL